jgi:predicted DNA-binding transcriptional regulator AlpA
MEQLISVKSFIAHAGVSRATWKRLVKTGQAPAITRIGRRTLVAESAAARWLESRTEQPTQAAQA